MPETPRTDHLWGDDRTDPLALIAEMLERIAIALEKEGKE